jgi:cyclic pyranopterin phosphate synthase
MPNLTHFNDEGRARMVDVSEKNTTLREATAGGTVFVNAETLGLIMRGEMKKGDVLAVAQVAGIMAAKRTSELIPMCHPIAIAGVNISFALDENRSAIDITATVRCKGETGVEMEALTAVSVAALTIYDMCKSAQKDIEITNVRLLKKTGGKSGEWLRYNERNEL